MNAKRKKNIRLLAVTLAIIAWTGTLLQFGITIHNALGQGKSVLVVGIGLFCYFTVLSNAFVAVVLTLPLCCGRSRLGRWSGSPLVQGCATTAILFVALVYHSLLRDTWDPKGWQWLVDKIQHYVIPTGMGLYWALSHEKVSFPRWAPLTWCSYPFLYFGGVVAGGRITGFYPYPFLHLGKLGWERVMLHGAGLIVAFLALGFVVRFIRVGWIRRY